MPEPELQRRSKPRIGRVDPQPTVKDAYSDWRRTVGHGCYAQDIDWVEWRIDVDGGVRFVALIETTFYEDKPHLRDCLPSYCSTVLRRFKEDGQGPVLQRASEALQVPAYLVIARYDLAVFFVCRLQDEAWRQMSESAYRRWLINLDGVVRSAA